MQKPGRKKRPGFLLQQNCKKLYSLKSWPCARMVSPLGGDREKATLLGAEKGGKQHSPFVPMQAE